MIIDDDVDITTLFSIFLEHNGDSIEAYTNPVQAFHNFQKNSLSEPLSVLSDLSIIPKYFACYCCYSEYITSNHANK